MGIEVGEYVRTKDGYIDKVVEDIFDERFIICNDCYIPKNDITKHSKNIIDLIELYDYVNNFLVFDIITYENDDKKIQLSTGVLIGNNKIENVVTHEQFSNIEYKVEE